MRMHSRFVFMLAALVLIASPLTGAAQSSLAAKDGADEGGKVTGSISADLFPEPQKITDISKDGTKLILKYTLDVQGQSIPAQTVLIPDGDKWKASFDFADGQFTVDGTAAKK